MADSRLTGLTELTAPALLDQAYLVDVSDTTDDAAGSSRRITLENVLALINVNHFRLGLENGVFVSTSDQSAKSVIYWNSGGMGQLVSLPNGTSFRLFRVPNLGLGGLTGLTSARNYDAFINYSTPTHSSTNTGTDVVTWSANPGWTTGAYVRVIASGTDLTVGTDYWYNRASSTTGSFHTSLSTAIAGTSKVNLTADVTNTLIGVFMDLGPTWNAGAGAGSDTARGTGAGSSALTTLNGAYVNEQSVTGAIGGGTIAASAGLYVGTIRTTGTTTTEDSAGGSTTTVGGKRFVWNHYNQVARAMSVKDTADNWTTSNTTFHAANAQTAPADGVEFVLGLSGGLAVADLVVGCYLDGVSEQGAVGIGLDAANAAATGCYYSGNSTSASSPQLTFPLTSTYKGNPGLGYHYLQWIEKSITGTVHFLGDNGGNQVNGMNAWILG